MGITRREKVYGRRREQKKVMGQRESVRLSHVRDKCVGDGREKDDTKAVVFLEWKRGPWSRQRESMERTGKQEQRTAMHV